MTRGIDAVEWLFFGGMALLWIALLGLVLRRSLVGMLVGLGLAWASVSLLAIAFALFEAEPVLAVRAGGLALVAAIVGCLQVAVGIALVVARVGRRGSIDAEEARLLEG
ncbi:MAG: NADH-quinone oxidoreductase subunit K [Myxococcota bacterium]